MGFGREGTKDKGIRKARVWHELCKRCSKPILPGEYYIDVDGSLTSNCGEAHLACVAPNHPLLREVK